MHSDVVSAEMVEQPVTRWLVGLRRGEAAATEGLWGVYFRRLRGLARRLLRGKVRRTCDGEDVAASVFRSFYDRARAGDFSGLRGRGDLWSLLAALTSNKCVDKMRREGRAKGGGRGRSSCLEWRVWPGAPKGRWGRWNWRTCGSGSSMPWTGVKIRLCGGLLSGSSRGRRSRGSRGGSGVFGGRSSGRFGSFRTSGR